MDNIKYFKNLCESIPDYRKIVLVKCLFKNDANLLNECGFSKNDINRLSLEFKIISLEQNEEYSDFIKNEKQSIIEQIL